MRGRLQGSVAESDAEQLGVDEVSELHVGEQRTWLEGLDAGVIAARGAGPRKPRPGLLPATTGTGRHLHGSLRALECRLARVVFTLLQPTTATTAGEMPAWLDIGAMHGRSKSQ